MVGARGSGNEAFDMDVVARFSVFVEGFKCGFKDFRGSSGFLEEIEPFLLGS